MTEHTRPPKPYPPASDSEAWETRSVDRIAAQSALGYPATKPGTGVRESADGFLTTVRFKGYRPVPVWASSVEGQYGALETVLGVLEIDGALYRRWPR